MCCLDVKRIDGMFRVCRDGQKENRNITTRVTAYRESFHAHYLVFKATVQKLLHLRH